MVKQSPAEWFARLGPANKTIVLSDVVFYFTLVIRDVLASPLDAVGVRRLQGVGELTHLIMPYIVALHRSDADRFADEDLINLLFAAAGDYHLENGFRQAWEHAARVRLAP